MSKKRPRNTEALKVIIDILQKLCRDIELGEVIVHLTMDHYNEVIQGAPPGVEVWETLPTGEHKMEIKLEIHNTKEAQQFQDKSYKWGAFADIR